MSAQTASTIAEIERIVLASGEWDGIEEVEFSVDGSTWSTVFVPEETDPTAFARATVHRKGVSAPTRVTISWAEAVPLDEEWRAKWNRNPMALFGSAAIRAAYRRAFRDLVEILPNAAEGDGEPAEPVEEIDWSARIKEASTLDEVMQIGAEAKRVRAFTTVLDREWRARRRELEAPAAVEQVTSAKPSRKRRRKPAGDLNKSMTALQEQVVADEAARHSRPTPRVLDKKRGA
ncbi:hypothetical protein EG850_11150 [Gulosibacter macacae]|uniref:Uncharacterized protein n=1 Tax=Gulosibacter macacae TaxID=2488791 RepID=A0A3P3VT46_9MICO|nr:hypothetical protein [Gulosibacter macacae]RRJ85935.1 hypothetical protein EG850_11150 [Gulosibacter macacae]